MNNSGGITFRGNDGLVENCLIDHNSGPDGGGIHGNDRGKVVNCTIVANTSTGTSGGGAGGNLTLVNSIVWGNSSSGSNPDIGVSDVSKVSYCASAAGVGTRAVTLNPEFKNEANFDYSLVASSSCLDKGSEASATTVIGSAVALDLSGATRKMGSEIEIGCYEFDPTVDTCAFAAAAREALVGQSIGFTASVSGFAGATDIVYNWSFTHSDRTVTSGSGSSFAFAAPKAGWYEVSLTASSVALSLQKTATQENYLYFAPATNYVTCAEVTDPVFPFDTTAHATPSLSDALEAARDGTVILLDKGTHEIAETFSIKKGVKIRGAGMSDTILYMTTAFNGVFTLNHADLVISDLTIEHARTATAYQYKPVVATITGAGGTLCRCRVTDATANEKAGAKAVIRMQSDGGRITKCLIDNNDITTGNSGGGAIEMTAGLVDNCVIVDNKSRNFERNDTIVGGGGIRLQGGKVVNCTILRNTIIDGVGGGVSKAADAILENCIIYDNVAASDTTDPAVSGKPNLGTSTANVRHCLVGQSVGTDPVPGAPELIDAPNGDYHLAASSPCRDVADVSRYLELLGLESIDGETDFHGFTRSSGTKIDIGASEYDADQVSCAFTIDRDTAFVPATFELTPVVEGLANPEAATLTWTFTPVHGGESVVYEQTGTNVCSRTLAVPEQYKVKLFASLGNVTGRYERADSVYAAARTNFVTNAKGIQPAFPYATAETAATNIADAVAAAVDGATVQLPSGTVAHETSFTLGKAITLAGRGMTNTTLYAETASSQLITLNHADAVLCDLTITNVHSRSFYVPCVLDFSVNGGTMLRCRVTGCSNGGQSYSWTIIRQGSSSGRISRCVIDNCTISGGNCGGGAVLMKGGVIDNSVIENCHSTYYKYDGEHAAGLTMAGGAALNCTVLGNTYVSTTLASGIHVAGDTAVVRNCIVDGNLRSNDEEANVGGTPAGFSCCLSPDFTSTENGNVIGRPIFHSQHPLVQTVRSPGYRKGSLSGYEDLLAGGTDLHGRPRVTRNHKSARMRIDIGCTESDAKRGSVIVFR